MSIYKLETEFDFPFPDARKGKEFILCNWDECFSNWQLATYNYFARGCAC